MEVHRIPLALRLLPRIRQRVICFHLIRKPNRVVDLDAFCRQSRVESRMHASGGWGRASHPLKGLAQVGSGVWDASFCCKMLHAAILRCSPEFPNDETIALASSHTGLVRNPARCTFGASSSFPHSKPEQTRNQSDVRHVGCGWS